MTLKVPPDLSEALVLSVVDALSDPVRQCSELACHVEQLEDLGPGKLKVRSGVGKGSWLRLHLNYTCAGSRCEVQVVSCQKILA